MEVFVFLFFPFDPWSPLEKKPPATQGTMDKEGGMSI